MELSPNNPWDNKESFLTFVTVISSPPQVFEESIFLLMNNFMLSAQKLIGESKYPYPFFFLWVKAGVGGDQKRIFCPS